MKIINSATVTFASGIAVAGTGTISRSGTTVTGVGTSFTTEVVVGDVIYGNTTLVGYDVFAITNNTSLTTSTSGAVASQTFSIAPKLTISGVASGDDLVVEAGSSLTLNTSAVPPIVILVGTGATGNVAGSMTVTGSAQRLLAADANAITFPNGSAFTTSTGFSGSAFGAANNLSVIFASGSTYTHNAGSNPFGATAPGSTVVFQSGSTAVYRTTTGFSASGRTYANLTLQNNIAISSVGSGNYQFQTLNVESGSSCIHVGSSAATVTIRGDITTAGTGNVSITAGSGSIVMDSGGTQVFGGGGGSGTITFGSSATINSGTTVNLSRGLALSAGALAVNGTLNTGSNYLDLGSTASVTPGEVSGNVRRTSPGNSLLTYNGPNTQITLTGSTLSNLVMTLTPGDPGNLSAYVSRKYTITPGSGSFTSATLRLSYKTTEFVNILPANESQLKLWRWVGGLWVYQGGTADTANHYIDLSGVTAFSDWAITNNGAPTAVKLSSFSA